MQELSDAGSHDVKPNTICFSSVINAWVKSGDPSAPQRAETILNRMQELFESGNHDAKPNTVCFNSVIVAWARSGDSAAPQRAEGLLKKMHQKMHEAGNHEVKPGTITFNSTISAWARSCDLNAGIRANRYLAYMKKVEALGHKDFGSDEIIYKTVIKAWSNSGHPDANREIAALRKEMEGLARTRRK
jgi:hypothetical protein